jgi:hypothetical protein
MQLQQAGFLVYLLGLFVIALFMLLVRHFDIELLFIIFLMGLLIYIELMDPRTDSRFARYLRHVAGAGILVMGLIVARDVLSVYRSILPP